MAFGFGGSPTGNNLLNAAKSVNGAASNGNWFGTSSAQANSPSWWSQNLGLNAAGSPQVLGNNYANAGIANQIPFMNAYYGSQATGAQNDYNNQLALLNLQQGNDSIQRDQYGRNIGFYQDMLNLDPKILAAQQAQMAGAASADVRQQNSQSTGAGAWFAPSRVTNNTATLQKMYQQQQQAALESQKEMDTTKIRMNDQQSQLDQLNAMGAQYGIKGAELKNNLQQSLDQLGYSRYTNLASLLDQAGSNNAQNAAWAQGILSQLLGWSQAYNSGAIGNAYGAAAGNNYAGAHGGGRVS